MPDARIHAWWGTEGSRDGARMWSALWVSGRLPLLALDPDPSHWHSLWLLGATCSCFYIVSSLWRVWWGKGKRLQYPWPTSMKLSPVSIPHSTSVQGAHITAAALTVGISLLYVSIRDLLGCPALCPLNVWRRQDCQLSWKERAFFPKASEIGF